MVLKIHGSAQSTCTRRVACVCKELGVDYEIVEVDWAKGEHKSPAHLVRHPFGQVPYVVDGEFSMYESRAIARYLVMKYGKNSGLLPSFDDLEAVQRFETAASIEQANFDGPASSIVAEKVFKPFMGGTTDEARVEEYVTKLKTKLDGYERILSKQKYLAGDTVTIADLFHLPYAWMTFNNAGYSELFTSRPNVSRWYNDISSRPSWQAVKDKA